MNSNAPTPKQALMIVIVAAILWVPMISFIIFYAQKFSPRQIAAMGAVNLIVGVGLLIFIYRTWIRNMR